MIPKSLVRVFESGGTKAVLVRGVKKLFRPLAKSGGLIFFERDLHQPLPPGRNVENVIAREAVATDLHLLDALPNASACKETALERFKRGDRWFVGIDTVTGKLANFRWITTGPAYIPEITRYIRLKPGEAYIYDMYTLPEFRKRGFDHCVRRLTYSTLAASGINKIVTYMCADNFVNQRASRHYLKKTGYVWYLQIRGGNLRVFGANRAGVPLLSTNPGS